MRWCYENDVPLTARGGGTGLAGGAIPVAGGVVIGFERLNRVRQFDPLLWRMHVEAGVTTGDIQRLARENGLRFPPDPGRGRDQRRSAATSRATPAGRTRSSTASPATG